MAIWMPYGFLTFECRLLFVMFVIHCMRCIDHTLWYLGLVVCSPLVPSLLVSFWLHADFHISYLILLACLK